MFARSAWHGSQPASGNTFKQLRSWKVDSKALFPQCTEPARYDKRTCRALSRKVLATPVMEGVIVQCLCKDHVRRVLDQM